MPFYEDHKKRMRELLLPPTTPLPLIQRLRDTIKKRKLPKVK